MILFKEIERMKKEKMNGDKEIDKSRELKKL